MLVLLEINAGKALSGRTLESKPRFKAVKHRTAKLTHQGSSDRCARHQRETTSYSSDHSDARTENQFSPVPYDDPAWGDSDRWELGPWLPEGMVLVPTGRNGFARMMRRVPRAKQ